MLPPRLLGLRVRSREAAAQVESALLCDAPIRVVLAAPGSGKTWLLAQVLKQALDSWDGKGGIAAVSFTRVAGDEVRAALGADPRFPHFVGTVDSFLYRNVFRPFFREVLPDLSTVHLMPGELHRDSPGLLYGGGQELRVAVDFGDRTDDVSIFDAHFVDVRGDTPVFLVKGLRTRRRRKVEGQEATQILLAKHGFWRRRGLFTHSDVAYLSSEILGGYSVGAQAIRASLVRRFPLLLVDELQDTGRYYARCLARLLKAGARGFLVGDPDQAIFEFNGAVPALSYGFSKLPGAAELRLDYSRRCPPAICAVVSSLSSASQREVRPLTDGRGQSLLIGYDGTPASIGALRAQLAQYLEGWNCRILVRKRSTVREVNGTPHGSVPALRSAVLTHLATSALAWRARDCRLAVDAAGWALSRAVGNRELLAEDELAEAGISPAFWRTMRSQLATGSPHPGEFRTWLEWAEAASACVVALDRETRFAFRLGKGDRLRKPAVSSKLATKRVRLDERAGTGHHDQAVEVRTVHSVKGETHDLTVYALLDDDIDRCPSAVWWSEVDEDREERRIAYVAASRPRRVFCLAVPYSEAERLRTSRPDFVALFREVDIRSCAEEWSRIATEFSEDDSDPVSEGL